MTELPKIVKSRLRQAQGAGVSPHPEANLLSAFTEQALTPGEREQVLAHLAVCRDCREIVSLSAPELPAAAVGAERPRGWLGLGPDFFRWGIVAASAAVVVMAVLLVKPELERAEKTSSLQVATSKPQAADKLGPTVPQPEASKDAGKAQAAAARPPQTLSVPVTVESSKNAAALAAPASGLAASNAVGGGVSNSVVAVAPAEAEQKVAEPARADAFHGAIVNAPASPMQTKANGPAADKRAEYLYQLNPGKEAGNEKLADAAGQAGKKDELSRLSGARERDAKGMAIDGAADSATTVEVAGSAPAARAMAMRPAMAKTKAEMQARTWRITEGQLEWSLDAGKSWQRVNAPGGARFLAVDSRRANVWAGGTSGVVIRSVDGGSTWVPVTTGWTGDVVYLKFEDEKRGTLKTSTGEEWFTEDGGASWKRR